MANRSKAQQRQQPPPPVEDLDESDDPVLNVVRFGVNNVKKYINETLPKCPTDRGKKAMAAKMEALLLRLIKSEMVLKTASGIVTQVVEEMPDNVTSEAEDILQTCDRIAETANQRIIQYEEGLSNQELKQHPMYERLMQDMEEAIAGEGAEKETPTASSSSSRQADTEEAEGDDSDAEEGEDGGEEDDELQVSNEEDLIPTMDPITKKPLTDPVRNEKCKHVYGKASISQMMKQNNKLRCPIPGCSNKNFLRVAHLVTDKKLTAEIKNRQQAARKSTRR